MAQIRPDSPRPADGARPVAAELVPARPEAAGERPWFQFSLRTLVILLLVAGALLGLNLKKQECVAFSRDDAGTCNAILFTTYGWPFRIRYEMEPLGAVPVDFAESALARGSVGLSEGQHQRKYRTEEYRRDPNDATYLEGGRIALDVFLSVLILAGVVVLSERSVRQRGDHSGRVS